jgi:hypothetical protein
MRRTGEVVFSLVVVIVAGFVVWNSAGWALRALGVSTFLPGGWGPRSGLFPLVIGVPTLALAIVQLMLDLRGAGRGSLSAEGGAAALDLPADVVRQRSLLILGTIVGFAVAIWLLGFLVAIPLVSLLYMKASGESWLLAIAISLATVVVFFVTFVWWLNIPVPPGLLLEPVLG